MVSIVKIQDAFSDLRRRERGAAQQLDILSRRLSKAKGSGNFGEIFMIERAYERSWQRREAVRDTLLAALEVFE